MQGLDLSPVGLFFEAGLVGKAVMAVLFVASLWCWVLIIEGVGAGRSEVSHLIDALVWVQADQQEAERRSLARVGQPDGARTVGDYREWMAEEDPFLTGQRPWEREDLLVAGTPQIPFDRAFELVVAPPLTR